MVAWAILSLEHLVADREYPVYYRFEERQYLFFFFADLLLLEFEVLRHQIGDFVWFPFDAIDQGGWFWLLHRLDLAIELVACLNEGGNLRVGGDFFLPFAIDLGKLLCCEGRMLKGTVFGLVDGVAGADVLLLDAVFKRRLDALLAERHLIVGDNSEL